MVRLNSIRVTSKRSTVIEYWTRNLHFFKYILRLVLSLGYLLNLIIADIICCNWCMINIVLTDRNDVPIITTCWRSCNLASLLILGQGIYFCCGIQNFFFKSFHGKWLKIRERRATRHVNLRYETHGLKYIRISFPH